MARPVLKKDFFNDTTQIGRRAHAKLGYEPKGSFFVVVDFMTFSICTLCKQTDDLRKLNETIFYVSDMLGSQALT